MDLDKLAPDLRGLFSDLGPLVRVSRKGLPATEQVLDNTRPILGAADPFLRELTPVVDYLGLYKREIAAFFANDSAATQAEDVGLGNTSKRSPLPAHAEPGEPRDDGRLAEPAGHQPLEPVHGAGRLRQARDRGAPRDVRRPTCARRTRGRRRPPAEPVPEPDRAPLDAPSSSSAARRTVARRRPATRSRPLGRLAGQAARLFPHLQPLP